MSVSAYTGGKVNVIGYSMGSPVARKVFNCFILFDQRVTNVFKAIMGGICVDTNEVTIFLLLRAGYLRKSEKCFYDPKDLYIWAAISKSMIQ